MQENAVVMKRRTRRADPARRAAAVRRAARLSRLVALSTLAAAACGDGGEPFDPNDSPARIEILSDTAGLAGTAGRQLAEPIRVRVTNWRGEPFAGAEAACIPQAGGACEVSPDRTGDDGRADVHWTLGPEAGTQTLRLGIVRGDSTAYVATVSARAGAPAP